MSYNSGGARNYWNWVGKYANQSYDHFARHKEGPKINYSFNSEGFRGPEFYNCPDITVFGSSFSFGVGIEFEQCWHQNLGDYKVNCYAPAGILVTNNDIIGHYHKSGISTGLVILQLREFRYNTTDIQIPDNVFCFVVDEHVHENLMTFSWGSWPDRAADNTHPGHLTHLQWAHTIKNKLGL